MHEDLKGIIRLIVLDADGTLTDGGIYYDEKGNEFKKFCTKDAAGILLCEAIGIDIMILTGRKSAAVEHRARDLHVKYVVQGIADKAEYLHSFMISHGLEKDAVFYIGDDLNDMPAMRLCGSVGCPSDAAEEIIVNADFIARHGGGHGAVRDVLFSWLKAYGLYESAIKKVYEK